MRQGSSDCPKTSQPFAAGAAKKVESFSPATCAAEKIPLRLQVWNLCAVDAQIMRAADCRPFVKKEYFLTVSGVVLLLGSLAEVELLETLDLVAHGLEAAARAVEILGHTLEDGVHGLGHVVDLLGRVVQGLEVDILRDEDHAHIRDVRVFLILLDEVAANLVKRDALLDGLLAHADLLTAALGRDAHHVAVREDVILHKLDVADGGIGRVLLLDVDVLDAEDDDARKRHVALDLLHIRAIEQHLVRRDNAPSDNRRKPSPNRRERAEKAPSTPSEKTPN